MSWLDPLFGRLFQDGTEIELRGGLNIVSPLKVTTTEDRHDVSLSSAILPDIYPEDLDYVGATDSSTALQAALNSAAYGQTVRLKQGILALYHGVTVPNGVRLEGPGIGHQIGPFVSDNALADAGYSGLTIYVYMTDEVPFTMSQESSMSDVLGYWPEQVFEIDGVIVTEPIAYEPFIDVPGGEHGVTLDNIIGINPYDFVEVGTHGPGDHAVGGILIRNTRCCPLNRGFWFGRLSNPLVLINCSINIANHFAYDSTLTDYIQDNSDGIILDGCESFFIVGLLVSRMNSGLIFQDKDADAFHGTYGDVCAFSFDQCNAPIHVKDRSLMKTGCGLNGGTIIPTTVGNGALFEDTGGAPAGYAERPTLRASNVRFHGVHVHSVNITAGSAGRWIHVNGETVGTTGTGAFRNDSTVGGKIRITEVDSASGVQRTVGTGEIVDNGGDVT